jgi:hypothetical protein
MKKFILVAALTFASVALFAQQGYDFAMVYSSDLKSLIYVIENGKEERLVPATGKTPQIQEKLLKTVSEMTQDGWEVISVGNNHTFYLRRLKR